MNRSKSGAKKATRQCWACLKRRLVCDHTLPHCEKCQKAGKECPGYDEQKPLQWIQPGKVNSRPRTKNIPPKIYTAPAARKDHNPANAETSSPLSSISSDDNVESQQLAIKLALRTWKPGTRAYWGYSEENHDQLVKLSLTIAADLKISDRFVSHGGRAKIEEVVSKKLYKEAAKLVRSKEEPLQRLERVLGFMRSQEIPYYNYLSDETSQVVQAVNYCRFSPCERTHTRPLLILLDNSQMYPAMAKSGLLAPNPAILLLPPERLHYLPPAFHHSLVCLTLNHFIQSADIDTNRAVLASTQSKAYHHRGAAIRALSEYVGNDKTRCTDLTIVCILQFMSVEVSVKMPSLVRTLV